MTREEYEKLIKEAYKRHSDAVIKIKRKYALSNNKYKIGDKIRDRSDFIEISEIKISMHSDPSECVYYGYLLKKDGTRMKSGKMSNIYQSHILEE